MRTRKVVITVTLAAAALAASAAPALAATAHPPYVAHNVGGGLLTRQAVQVGQMINLVGSASGRISGYRVTAEHRDGEAWYVTVWPRLQKSGNSEVLFTTSN
jgi:hypothetical protein